MEGTYIPTIWRNLTLCDFATVIPTNTILINTERGSRAIFYALLEVIVFSVQKLQSSKIRPPKIKNFPVLLLD